MHWLIIIVAAIFLSASQYSSLNIWWCAVILHLSNHPFDCLVFSNLVSVDSPTGLRNPEVGRFFPPFFSSFLFPTVLLLSCNYKVLCSSIIYCCYQLSALLSGSPLIWWKWNQKRTLFWCGWILMAGRRVPFVNLTMLQWERGMTCLFI